MIERQRAVVEPFDPAAPKFQWGFGIPVLQQQLQIAAQCFADIPTVEQIEQSEILARKALLESNEVMLRDGIMRAYGVLSNAYRLTFKEFEEKFALVKLGVYYGFINVNDKQAFEGMLDKYRPANMMTHAKKIMNDNERDLYRAANVAAELRSLTA